VKDKQTAHKPQTKTSQWQTATEESLVETSVLAHWDLMRSATENRANSQKP
jgi:hypothetical protein